MERSRYARPRKLRSSRVPLFARARCLSEFHLAAHPSPLRCRGFQWNCLGTYAARTPTSTSSTSCPRRWWVRPARPARPGALPVGLAAARILGMAARCASRKCLVEGAKDVSTRACAWDLQPGPDAAQFRTISIVFETEDSRVIRLSLISGCATFSPALTLRLFKSAVGTVGNLASRLEAPRRKR
jgi:hypothetical protein